MMSEKKREYCKQYYQKNKERIKEYNRQRYQKIKEIVKARSSEWAKKNKDKHNENSKRRRKNNPDKLRAHYLLNNAIRDGRMERQPCVVCGQPEGEAHHEDYSKPLDVLWLCKAHHTDYHRRYLLCPVFTILEDL